MSEILNLKVFIMPCCKHALCWINPRLPNYCPECGTSVYKELRANESDNTLKNDIVLLRSLADIRKMEAKETQGN